MGDGRGSGVSRDLFGLMLNEDLASQVSYTDGGRLTADTLRAAIAKVKEMPQLDPMPYVLSPAGARMVRELAEVPDDMPLTYRHVLEAQQRLYDRCTPEERKRLVELILEASSCG